ncbi:unnamed protein product [Ilex paraguariensis]|uniref:Uncharacterized protein n=1 Tax=Ilex paraguariensis TaxID=185542 RepID=A0ABC8TNS7_9AQUA
MAVQRQTAASRSARPPKRLQHGFFGGVPTTMLSNPRSKSAQTPNFRASLGHVPLFGFGFGLGLGVGQVPHALTKVKNRRLKARKRASDAVFLEPIPLKSKNSLLVWVERLLVVVKQEKGLVVMERFVVSDGVFKGCME